MKSDYFYDIAEKVSIHDYIEKLDGRVLFIYSPTSLEKIDIRNSKILFKNWHHISKNVEKIDEYIKTLNNIEEIITFGGGSTIDIGKYISSQLNIKYTCIPSMLSTNAYATDKAALIKNEKKVTIVAKMPDKIIIDDEVLKLSKDENLYGLADVLSIHTALYDWKIANEDIKETIDKEIYEKAKHLLNEVLEFIQDNSLEHIVESNMKLFQFIGEAGYITNLYGTGRPESGSEHIMAKEIERRIDMPHGISVSIGILSMVLLQNRNITRILGAIQKMKILESSSKFGLSAEIIEKSFLNLTPRIDRYTIVNRHTENMEHRKKVIESFLKIVDKQIITK